jgi:F0F1-type ATP synthase membrane subunit b/b'
MAIAFTMMGLVLGLLGILCTYVWKGNYKMEKAIMESQERIEMGQERMEKVLVDGFNILKEGQKILMEGQREIAQIVKEGQRELAQMLLTQTRILERIEGKIPAPSAG